MMSNEKSVKFRAKKFTVFAMLIAALAGAVYLNWHYSAKTGSIAVSGAATEKSDKYLGDAKYVNATAAISTAADENNYFTQTKEKRDKQHKQSVSELKAVIDNVKSPDEAKVKASESMARLAKIAQSETNIESLITAKGFADCAAVISDKSVSVVVKSTKKGLLPSETKQIQDIVTSNSDISLENIKIIEIK